MLQAMGYTVNRFVKPIQIKVKYKLDKQALSNLWLLKSDVYKKLLPEARQGKTHLAINPSE